jgi:ketosteroid isomerase-like protein
MRAPLSATAAALCALGLASCSPAPAPSAGASAGASASATAANAGIDSLNVRLVNAYRSHDAQAYAALYTDSAVFEWPAFDTVRGSTALGAMAQGNWAALRDMDLRLTVADRRIAADHATEIGAFEQSWRDSSGARMAEFGRYVAVLALQPDGSWRMDRFFGFSDSTRTVAARP